MALDFTALGAAFELMIVLVVNAGEVLQLQRLICYYAGLCRS